MARIFRYLVRNILFTGWRVLFQHKEPDNLIKDDTPKAGPSKTLEDIYEEKKYAPPIERKAAKALRVLLINSNRFKQPWPVMPYGLLCVAASCDKAGHTTKVLDLCFSGDTVKDISSVISSFNPEVIGITIRNIDNGAGYNTLFLLDGVKKEVIDPVKRFFKGPIIIGGPSVGINSKEMLGYFDLEYAVKGDGEACFTEALNRISKGSSLIGLDGLVIRSKEGAIIHDPSPYRVADMNKLSYPNPARYLNLKLYRKFDSPLQIQSKRGCMLKCSYCTYNRIEGSACRLRDPKLVADEIEKLVKDTGIRHVEFTDSVFNIPLNHTKEVLREIIKKKLKLRLRTLGLNPGAIDEELVTLMKKAGMHDVDLGVESASDVTLRSLGKNYTKSDVIKTGKLLQKHKISINWYLLVGAPSETPDTLKETIDTVTSLASKWDLVTFGIGIRAYNGSPISEELKKNNPGLYKDNFLSPVKYEPGDITLDKVKDTVKRASFKHPNIFMYDEDETAPLFLQKTGALLMKLFAPQKPIWKLFILNRYMEHALGIRRIKRIRYMQEAVSTLRVSQFKKIRILLSKAAYSVLRLIVTSSLKITIEGKENIPDTSNAVIVANHSSYLDVPVMGVAFFDNLIGLSWVVSKSNYKLWFLKWLWLVFKPIVTGDGGSVNKIKNDLNSGRWVVIFPEGNERWCPPSEAARRRQKPSSGAAVIALSTGAAVIPVGITGADKVLPVRSFKLDTRYHITVKIGKPFSYKKADDEDISPELLNQTRQEIMNRVYSLVYYRNREEDKRVQEEAPAIKIIDPVTAPITISDILRNKAKETPSSVGFWKKSGGAWLSITWSDYLKKIEIIAANLSSLGIKKGDKAIIISNTRHEWEMAEKAFLLIGVVVCGIDPSMSAKEMSLIADKVEPSVIVAENNDILEKIPSGLAARQKAVILIENKCGIKSPEIITWESIAVDSLKSLPAVDIRPDDTAAIIYTSGSSGEPKMIAYRHRQLVKACLSVSKLLKGYGPGDRAISWLPLAYMTSRMFNLSAMHAGVQLYYISDVTTLSSEMKAVRPTIFIGVPRFFEKVYDAINRAIDDQPIYVRGLVRIAIRLNKNRKRWGVLAEAASRFFLERIRSAFGGDLKLAISGSAPLARHILNFFAAIGIPVFEAYAMSENAIPMTMNSPYRFKFGTVGLPLDGNEIRFAEDGEILVKSSGVFEGYYRDEAPRPDIFDKDGFLRTGDLGYLDKDGFLILTGRKKEIIKTSTGNRVSPIEVESAYGGIPYIENIVIIGNERKYITAVLTINKKNVAGWCVKNMVSFKSEDDLWALPEVRKLLEGAIEQKHGELAGYKQVKKFAILSGHFSADTGELTTNLKIRRSFIESKYSSEIERMYSS